MKNLKLLIIILTLLALGIVGVIVVLNIQNQSNENIVNTNINIENSTINNSNMIEVEGNVDSERPQLTYNTSLQEVTSNTTLYSISTSINNYFNYIKQGNTEAVNELGGNNIYSIANNVKYVVKQAISTENAKQTKYYTYGTLTIANGDNTATQQEIYMLMYLDLQNNTYKLENITKGQYENPVALQQEETISMQKGKYNNFEYEYVDTVKQIEIYLEEYSFQIFNNTEEAYNLLNEKYREKRFGTIDEFRKYINEKQSQLKDIKITQYRVDDNVYKGMDKYGNYYHIIEKDYMTYQIILDNYTMQADYSNESANVKVEKSAEKFVLMINAADYTNAYNLLNPTFKQANFPTEQDFIKYVKNNWFERNIIAKKEVVEDGICIITMREAIETTAKEMKKEFNVTMSEGMNFTIEFDI